MGARNGSEHEDVVPKESAVERSLDDFIARANSTLPAPTPSQAAVFGKKRRKKDDGTLGVLGSSKPLAEVTEIVNRLPAGDLESRPGRSFFSVRLGLAFAAGAAAVLIITRFLTGHPEPVRPVAPPAAPPIVVEQLATPPAVEPMPVAPAPAPAPTPVPVPEPAPTPTAVVTPEEPPVVAEPAPVATPRKKPPVRKPPVAPKKKGPGLVDPFAP